MSRLPRAGSGGSATGTLAAGGGGVTALATTGAPWWAILAVAISTMVALGLQTVFPQESQHRLDWWRDRRRHQRRPLPGPREPRQPERTDP